jgi:G3E family GTPase
VSPLAPVAPAQRVPVTLVTGFLGSGKTTLINRLLRQSDLADAAVIVNELGDIGIDNMLLETVDSTTALLESGCICCTVRDELAVTMQELLERRERGEIPRFARLVIETTGMADPGPISRLLLTDPLVATRYALASVVTTIDAVNGASTLERHVEAASQAALADRLILTKTDLAAPADADALLSALRRVNPTAPLVRAAEEEVDGSILAGAPTDPAANAANVSAWLRPVSEAIHDHDAHGHHDHDHHGHDHLGEHDIRTFDLIREEPLSWTQVSRWLQSLGELPGEDLLRVKGIVNVAGLPGPAIVHGVQRVIHVPAVLPSWPDGDRRTRIVCITRGIARERLEQLLDAACAV